MTKNIKIITLTASVLAAIILSGTALAQTDTYIRTSKNMQQVQMARQRALEQARQLKQTMMEKVAQIKDQSKKNAAQKIANQFERINQVWTDHFTNVLDGIEDILFRIEKRANYLASQGQDVSLVKTEIDNAKNKISAARSAVLEQSKKTYIIDSAAVADAGSAPASQSNLMAQLRVQFKSLRDKLFADLTLIRDGAMKEARQAVQDSLQELYKVPGSDDKANNH